MAPAKATTSVAADLRSWIDRALERHEKEDGRGPDPYSDADVYHPMADGKFLLSLMSLVRAGVLSKDMARKFAAHATARLSVSGVHEDGGTGWGLGFPWRDTGSDTTFTITSSIVVHGLADCVETLGTRTPAGCNDLLTSAHGWLSSVERVAAERPDGPPVQVPVFSTTMRSAVTNVVAYWMGACAFAGRVLGRDERAGDDLLAWIHASYQPGVGWPYSPGSNRLDLLHQGYILNGLALIEPHPRLEKAALAVQTRFWDHGGIRDKIDDVPLDEALASWVRADSVRLQLDEERALVIHAAPARGWSIGELAVLVATMAREGERATYWRSMTTRIGRYLATALAQELEGTAAGPRHAMHLAHGAAEVLSVMRRG